MNTNADYKKIQEMLLVWESPLLTLNKLINAATSEVIVDSSDIQGVFISALFQQVLSNCIAAIELISTGFIDESKIIIRTGLEALFVLRAISKDRENIFRLLKNDDAFRRKMINIIEERPHFSPLKKELKELKIQKPDKEKFQETGVEDWSKLAQMHEFYDYAYRTLSNESHANLISIMEKLVLDDSGKLTGFKTEPKYSQINKLMFTLLITLTLSLSALDEKFLEKYGDQISEISNVVSGSNKELHII